MKHDSFDEIADAVTARLRKRGVKLTMGGEPSYVPIEPTGPEWSITAVGPTKLRYAYALADALMAESLPGAIAMYSAGKLYPGEVNPRWAVHLFWNRDGSSLPAAQLARAERKAKGKLRLASIRRDLLKRLKLHAGRWHRAHDALQPESEIWALPLDHDGKKWFTKPWPLASSKPLTLVQVEGPAGLRLPLGALPPNTLRRALVLEKKPDGLHVFFPPLLQKHFLALLDAIAAVLRDADAGRLFFEGYVPGDDARAWTRLSLTPDPGVLEVNLPPCESAREYARWLSELEKSGATVGLRSFKQPSTEEALGTGGGNHILFGGPSLDENAFFNHPRWVTAILRYWQRHPSLSYFFTGSYVGASSQAPRPDESSRELYDLEMAYRFLETLEPGGDHRFLISETLRHLHIDGSGNTHRSEISFDKFWNTAWDGGSRGLIEFRAVESLPRADWMSTVALLWAALAAFLFEAKTQPHALIEHGARLHDFYFLPTPLWADFEIVLRDLRRAGYRFDPQTFRTIWDWRFPQMLGFERGGAELGVRKALEGWPLLCETPLEGGNTSRFVDTSIERLEFLANKKFAAAHRVFVQGRELNLEDFPGNRLGAGLRYRRSALYPSLHPGIAPHMPLYVVVTNRARRPVSAHKLEQDRRLFASCDLHEAAPLNTLPCKKLRPDLLTSDLRLA
jgi:uncharacterized protein (DUF2126 family)